MRHRTIQYQQRSLLPSNVIGCRSLRSQLIVVARFDPMSECVSISLKKPRLERSPHLTKELLCWCDEICLVLGAFLEKDGGSSAGKRFFVFFFTHTTGNERLVHTYRVFLSLLSIRRSAPYVLMRSECGAHGGGAHGDDEEMGTENQRAIQCI